MLYVFLQLEIQFYLVNKHILAISIDDNVENVHKWVIQKDIQRKIIFCVKQHSVLKRSVILIDYLVYKILEQMFPDSSYNCSKLSNDQCQFFFFWVVWVPLVWWFLFSWYEVENFEPTPLKLFVASGIPQRHLHSSFIFGSLR